MRSYKMSNSKEEYIEVDDSIFDEIDKLFDDRVKELTENE